MDAVFLVYKTDSRHSYASRDVIGIATSVGTAIDLCRAQAVKEGETISEEQRWNLKHLSQTQGYSGAGEFQYEGIELDKLL